ncbi:unnamed protein product [Natator depressus]
MFLATRVVFCKDGEEILSQKSLLRKLTYGYDLVVSKGSSGNYSCEYEIRDRDNRVIRSQLSPIQHLSLTAVMTLAAAVMGVPPQVMSLSSDQRERVQHDTSNTPEDHIESGRLRELAGKLQAFESILSPRWSFWSGAREVTFSFLTLYRSALPGPTLYLSQTSARPGDSVLLQCSVFSQLLATRIVFCKDGEEVSSQRGSEEKITYDYVHVVSMGSSGNYSCGYEIKDSNNQVNGSQLSPAQHFSITSKGDERQSESNSPYNGRERIQMQKAE